MGLSPRGSKDTISTAMLEIDLSPVTAGGRNNITFILKYGFILILSPNYL